MVGGADLDGLRSDRRGLGRWDSAPGCRRLPTANPAPLRLLRLLLTQSTSLFAASDVFRTHFAAGASEMYCEQMVPARDSPLAAVIRI